MKNIGILTFSRANNYGELLRGYILNAVFVKILADTNIVPALGE